MAMCIGWKSPDKCGRKDQITAPASTCPDITWFWLGAAGVLLASLMTGKKERTTTA